METCLSKVFPVLKSMSHEGVLTLATRKCRHTLQNIASFIFKYLYSYFNISLYHQLEKLHTLPDITLSGHFFRCGWVAFSCISDRSEGGPCNSDPLAWSFPDADPTHPLGGHNNPVAGWAAELIGDTPVKDQQQINCCRLKIAY